MPYSQTELSQGGRSNQVLISENIFFHKITEERKRTIFFNLPTPLLKMDALVICLLLCRARKDNILAFTINADYSICYEVFISSRKVAGHIGYW